MNELRLSVLIPSYRRAALLPRILDAWVERLQALPPMPDGRPAAELVVVDDGSDDGSDRVLHEAAERHAERVQVRVQRQANAGRAAARNRAIEAARGTVLLFSDDDMLPLDPDLPARHLRAQERKPGAWVGRLVVPDEVVDTPFQAAWRRRLHRGTERLQDGAEMGRGGFWFATLSLPRRLLGSERFDEAFRGYGWEDLELGYRLHRSGVRARFLRDATIAHLDPVDLPTTLAKYRAMGRAAWTFSRLHPGPVVALWTGTHPLSRWARTLMRQRARAERLRGTPEEELNDAQLALLLEGAYAEGLAQGRPGAKGAP